MQDLCTQVRSKWEVTRIAIGHRTGRVDVEQASVVICVTSAHRREALEACAWLIDELKAVVPIWKKEFFADGSVWKENAESRRLHCPHEPLQSDPAEVSASAAARDHTTADKPQPAEANN